MIRFAGLVVGPTLADRSRCARDRVSLRDRRRLSVGVADGRGRSRRSESSGSIDSLLSMLRAWNCRARSTAAAGRLLLCDPPARNEPV